MLYDACLDLNLPIADWKAAKDALRKADNMCYTIEKFKAIPVGEVLNLSVQVENKMRELIIRGWYLPQKEQEEKKDK